MRKKEEEKNIYLQENKQTKNMLDSGGALPKCIVKKCDKIRGAVEETRERRHVQSHKIVEHASDPRMLCVSCVRDELVALIRLVACDSARLILECLEMLLGPRGGPSGGRGGGCGYGLRWSRHWHAAQALNLCL